MGSREEVKQIPKELYLGEFSVKFLRIARMEYCFADAVPVLREAQAEYPVYFKNRTACWVLFF